MILAICDIGLESWYCLREDVSRFQYCSSPFAELKVEVEVVLVVNPINVLLLTVLNARLVKCKERLSNDRDAVREDSTRKYIQINSLLIIGEKEKRFPLLMLCMLYISLFFQLSVVQ